MKVSKILFIAVALLYVQAAKAQAWLELKEKGANFNQIEAAYLKENSGKIKEFKRELLEEANGNAAKSPAFEKEMESMVQYNRWATFVAPRVRESKGDLSAMSEGMFRAMVKKNGELQSRAANWTLVGPQSTPSNGGNGRINAVRQHPTDANTIFVCSPAGGLWKSINAGGSWTPISNSIAAAGATDVAFDPTNPNTMYLATGDGDAADVLTLGVYKSTDAGATWNPTTLVFNLSDAKTLSKILVNPTNGNTIIVGGRAGIYRSTDAGATWTQTSTAGVRDLEFKPGDASVVYAGGYGASAGFWRSTDGGATWTKNTVSMTTGVQRVAVAVSSLNANYVYALAAKTTSYGFEGLYLSTDGGTTFTKKSATPNILGWYTGTTTQSDATNGQGWYDLSLAVSPTNINNINTGGVNSWSSADGGSTWTKRTAWDAAHTASNYLHADVHDLNYGGSVLYGGCDGGVFKSLDNGVSWTDISSNLSNAQLYGLGLSTTSATTILSGHQDNGTNLTTNGTSWSQVNGGDGMLCFIDRTNNNNMFSSIYNGSLYRSTNGGASFSSIYTVPGGAWVTPWLQDPVTATTLYAGGTNIYRSTNSGTAWSAISSVTGGTGNSLTFVSIDVAKTNNQVIYASADAANTTTGAFVVSKVFKSINGGTAWTEIQTGLPAGAILGVHVDVNDANKVYVGIASYTGNAVYCSANGGTTWTNISAGLPQVPANCFVTQTNAAGVVYCGTDLGVYFSNNSGATWQSFTSGMPGVPVKDLEIYYGNSSLVAATYGRGIWKSNLNGVNQTPSVSITSPTTGAVFASPATVTINATATDADGTVSNVEFYNGTTLLGSDNIAPYSFTWSNVAVGSYVITAKAYDNNNASTASTAVNISVSVANDAGISAIATPNGTVGTASVTPSVSLRNFGSTTLTTASIFYKVDNGTESTFNWTGSLASGATASVTLAAVTGYAAGNHTFTARAASPNGGVDGNAANDATTSNFSYSSCSNSNEPTDNASTTATVLAVNTFVNSQIGTTTDVDYYKFTTTTAAPKIKITLTNLPGDYDITLYKSTGAGAISTTIASSTNSSTLSETITYNTPTAGATYYIKVFGYNGANSTTVCYNLALNTSSTNFIRPFEGNAKGDKIVSENVVLKLYPNPANEAFTIQYNAAEAGEYDVKVYDILGKEMVSMKTEFALGQNAYEVKTNELAKGIYFVKVSNDTQSDVNKLIIEK
jgi:hypothetical protein